MKNLNGKRAILYRRVSTAEQKKTGNSLNSQKDQLRNFCYNKEIQIIKEFEEDYSAKNFNRPEWKKLNDFAKKNRSKVDFLLVFDWDRFSRNTYEALGVINDFNKLNIEVNCVEKWVDYNDPTQIMMQLMYLGLPEVDNRIRSQKVKMGMRQGRKEGRWNVSQPFGYIPGVDHFGKTLMKVDPDKGQLLKSLFEIYSSGNYTQSEILEMTTFKPLKLSKSNLSRILKNKIYVGYYDLSATENEPKQTIRGLHEPITDIITFNKIQELFKVRSLNKQKPKAFNKKLLLRGHLRCSRCGGNLTGSASTSKTGKKHYYYHCSSKRRCNERFRAELANSKFEDYLKQFDIRPEVKRLFVEILKNQFSEFEVERFNQIKSIKDEIDIIEKNKNILLDKLIDGVISDVIFNKKEKEYIHRINNLEVDLSNLNDYENDLKDFINFAIELMTNINKMINYSDEVTLPKFMSSIFEDKLEFEKESYRTPKLNPSIDLIFQSINGLELNKNKKGDTFLDVSHEVHSIDLFSNQTIEIFRKLATQNLY